MLLTVIKRMEGDDYTVHQVLARKFQNQKILFQRWNGLVQVLSSDPAAGHGRWISVKDKIEGIKAGDVLNFTIRINPTVSKKDDDSRRRGSVKSVPASDLKRWLDNKFIKCGFWANYEFSKEGFRESVKAGTIIAINSVLVYGKLEVLNPADVKNALLTGIGRGKGLGYGMLHIYGDLVA